MVHVIENYYFETDTYCYVALEDTKKVNNEGEPIYNTIGYYDSADEAINGIAEEMHRNVAKNDNLELKEYIKKCEEINTELKKVVRC